MIFWLCTAFKVYYFTSLRIPTIVACISVARSNGHGFIAVWLQVCSLAHTRHLKNICLSHAHQGAFQQFTSQQLSWWPPRHTQFSEAVPWSLSPSDDTYRGQGSPNILFSNATTKMKPANTTVGLYCLRQWRSQRIDAVQS